MRSCICCTRGKARCDNKRPACSRCTAKGIECLYSSRTQQDDPSPRTVTASPTVADSTKVDEQSGVSAQDGPATPDVEDLEWPFPDWNDPAKLSAMEFTKLMSADLTGQVMPFSLGSDPSAERSMFLPEQIAHLFTPPESIPRSPTANLRSLIRRPRASVGAQRVAALISHNLKSYPRMMSQRNNLPPFIHPHILAVAPENNHLAPLTNCMNLVHMVGGGIQGSRALFWRNVRTECEDWSVKVIASYAIDKTRIKLTEPALEAREVGAACCNASSADLHHNQTGRRRDGAQQL